MDKQVVRFATKTRNGVVQQVGKSHIMQPRTNYKGGGIKWFDDTTLIRKKR